MRFRFWRCFFLLLTLSLSVSALDPGKSLSQFCFDAFSVNNGFPSSVVLDILETRDGIVWMATNMGLAAFDGKEFRLFSTQTNKEIASNQLMDLYEDRSGKLWISTWGGGLLCLSKGKFQVFTTQDGLADNNVRCVCEDKQASIWVGTEKGLSLYRNGKWRTFTTNDGLPGNSIKDLCLDRKGCLWISAFEGGVTKLENGNFISYNTRNGLPSNYFYAILEDNQGNLLIGGEGGVFRYKEERFVREPGTEMLSGTITVRRLYEDVHHTLWIGTASGLFYLHDRILKRVEYDTLKDQVIFAIAGDRQGSLWIGTGSGSISDGAFRLRPGRFTTFASSEGMENERVWSIMEVSADEFLIGTEAGIYVLKGNSVHYWDRAGYLKRDAVTSLCLDSQGRTWAGTLRGLTQVGSRSRPGSFALPDQKIRAIVQDEAGCIWAGTDQGLFFLQPGANAWKEIPGMRGKVVKRLSTVQPSGLWVCTENAGAFLLRGREIIRSLGKGQGISSIDVTCIYEQKDGSLVIGTGNSGLNWIKDQQVFSFSTRDGLPSDQVYSILEDGSGNLWISSNSGIYKVSRMELAQYAAGKLPRINAVHYTELDGLKSRTCSGGRQNVAMKTSSGRFCFATAMGLAVVDPNKGRNMNPPGLFIKEVKIDDRLEVSFLDTLPQNLHVPAGKKRIEFRFLGLPCTRPERMRFQYRLDGFDREWVYAGQQRSAEYTNLGPGTYVFRVKASNEEGIWNERGASLELVLHPFIFQRGWFKILALLLFATVFSTAVHYVRNYVRAMSFWRKRHYVSHYKLLESVGTGGMGTVYRAKDTVHPYREVALKVLRDTDFANADQKKRFKKESQIIEKLDHPNIVKILEKGEQDDLLYLAMEYLKGETLFEKLKREKRLGLAEGLHIMVQVSGVLAKIHEKKIVHRDLKPQNIMLIQKDDNPFYIKLLDFGVAVDFNQSRFTESGIIVGTLRYLPPEAIQNGISSAPGDVYSLGVIFYEVLTGIRPFSGETTVDILLQIMQFQTIAPEILRKEIPPPLGSLVMEMIDRDPEKRPLSKDLLQKLKQIRSTYNLFLPQDSFSI